MDLTSSSSVVYDQKPKIWLRILLKQGYHYRRSIISHRFIIKLILIIVTISHSWYLASNYLSDKKTTVTNATFYNENHHLHLPQFLLCFSKVFTYNHLSESELAWIYNQSQAWRVPSLSRSNWELNVNDVILSVKFNGKSYSASSFFVPVFHLPTKRCWKTDAHNFTAGQAGQIHTLNLVINAAVYDDLITKYRSPLTYLSIVPYFPRSETIIPGGHSSTKISPGRLSSVGFSLVKVDSTHRSKHDARLCDKSGRSVDDCISAQYRHALKTNCHIDQTSVATVENYVDCALALKVDTTTCSYQPCKFNVFHFTKSEAYLKFDNRLALVGLNGTTVSTIASQLKMAYRRHSKFNPDVKRSFREIASELDILTRDISDALVQPRGQKCEAIIEQDIHLNSRAIQLLPSVIAERESIRILQTTFIRYNEKMFQKLARFVRKPTNVTKAPAILPTRMKNTEPISPFVDTKVLKINIAKYANTLQGFIALFEKLYDQTIAMSHHIQNLEFTKFIRQYSTLDSLTEYNKLLHFTGLATHDLTTQLFEGKNPTAGYYAHNDLKLSVDHRLVTLSQFPRPTNKTMSALHNAYPGAIWMQRIWLLHKGLINRTNEVFSTSLFKAIYSGAPKRVKIPLAIQIYCRNYVTFVAKSEKYFGVEPTFSLQTTNSKFKLNYEAVLFELTELFQEYDDTSVLLSIDHDGIDGAEHRACTRLDGHPIYLSANATFHEASQTINAYFNSHTASHVKGKLKVSHRAEYVLTMIAQYLISLSNYKLKSADFIEYYSRHVTTSFGSLIRQVDSLRQTVIYFQKSAIQQQNHKRFLIARLQKLAQLIYNVNHKDDSEEQISHFLTKKGKTLIGEIQFEIAEIDQVLLQASREERHHRHIIDSITQNIDNHSLSGAVTQAVLTAKFHSDVKTQQSILQILSQCNHDKWTMASSHLGRTHAMMVEWLPNITKLVTRARRYTSSTEITNSFLRKNIMRISLYYDSLTVLTETSAPLYRLEDMLAKFGAALRIYLKMGTFRILDIVTSSFAKIMWLLIKWIKHCYT